MKSLALQYCFRNNVILYFIVGSKKMSVTDAKNIDYDIQNDNEVFNILGKILDSVNAEDQELKVCAYVFYIYYVCTSIS